MKRKLIENMPVPGTIRPQKGWQTTVQKTQEILIFNTYKEGILYARHALRTDTGEHETLYKGKWNKTLLTEAIGADAYWYSWEDRKRLQMSEEDMETVRTCLNILYKTSTEGLTEKILGIERDYDRNKREMAEMRRIQRLDALMDTVPPVPEDLEEFADGILTGGKNWMLKGDKGIWHCTACGRDVSGEKLKKAFRKLTDKSMIQCPECKADVEYRGRTKRIEARTTIALVQPVNNEMAAVTHYSAWMNTWACGGKQKIGLEPKVRILIYKGNLYCKAYCEIFYRQWEDRWDRHNPRGCRARKGYLYDAGIEEAFKGTHYEPWSRLFIQMAAAGQEADYNRLMAAAGNQKTVGTFEMLFRGRFYRMLCEESEKISLWNWGYYGFLRIGWNTVEDVLNVPDKQMINRVRDRDGGYQMVQWMQYGIRHKTKISDKVLDWTEANKMRPEDMNWILLRMSPEKAMNYIERQRKESYPGKTAKQVLEQYEDYMEMCRKLEKDTTDEMIYRPRELKRRHDECVTEVEKHQADIQASEYARRYPEAENVLKEIREKLQYTGEEYFIKVPDTIVDIVTEGRYLHHCVGSTDRYFDRIKDHETYICFLRKKEEPDTPFYTIEVEPGGTIRQHRGMYDEEPELDKVRPFLREWQQEIRKRMKEEDHEREARSAVLREKNMQELREKNNTRVLKSLEEDFMAAVG